MADRYFVDTNVLVYARDASEPEKQPVARTWMQWLWKRQAGRLSTQVLQEFYQTVTRKLQPGLDPTVARAEVRDLGAWNPVAVDGALLEHAWALEDKHRFSWWDALIVAAACQSECQFLLTEAPPDESDRRWRENHQPLSRPTARLARPTTRFPATGYMFHARGSSPSNPPVKRPNAGSTR